MDTGTALVPSTIGLVALKAGDQVKSRLATVTPTTRHRLAWAMAVDTLAALSQVLAEVWVVTDLSDVEERLAGAGIRATVLRENGPGGMNAALRAGDRALRAGGVADVLACVGDLPALRPAAVRLVLSIAADRGRWFLADRAGSGTTMLLARGLALDPLFQGDSAERHERSGARRLEHVDSGALQSARCDVDTEQDLAVAYRIGVGAATSQVLAAAPDLVARLAPARKRGG